VNADEVPFDERVEAIEDEDRPSTWEPEDLAAYLDGTHVPEEPALMPRSDGACLLYPGRVHSFHGESESGKSMIAQAEAARVLTTGGSVAYLDFESDASVVVTRLLQMGAPAEAIRERFHYLRPDTKPHGDGNDRDRAAYARLLDRKYTLAVIDGVTEMAVVFGITSSKDNDEMTRLIRTFIRRLAQRTGAAVVQVDHVTKDADSRGRFAIGAGAKMNALDGSAFVVEVKEPLGVGMRGIVVMRVAKDRPGRVRPQCGKWRASDRTQEAARVVIDSTVENVITVTVESPSADSANDSASGEAKTERFRPTVLMERVSRFVEGKIDPPSQDQIMTGVSGNEKAKKAAVELLAEEGYIDRHKVGNAWRHRHVKEYLEIHDPRSGKYQPPLAEIDQWKTGDSDREPPVVPHGPSPLSARGYTPGMAEAEIRPPLPPPLAEVGGGLAEMAETMLAACQSCFRPTDLRDPDGKALCDGCTCARCGYNPPGAVEHEICCTNRDVETDELADFMKFQPEVVTAVRDACAARLAARRVS
jgi:hypothetical protein